MRNRSIPVAAPVASSGIATRYKTMMRELAVELYLFVFRVLFFVVNWLPVQKKVVFVDSFGHNSLLVYEEMQRQGLSHDVVFLRQKNCRYLRQPNAQMITLGGANPFRLMRAIYHLATAQTVFVDNYYAFLSVVSFKSSVQCIQLWHAAGAVKTFGLLDASIQQRSARARRRFVRVYQKFDKVVVGSDAMADIFVKAFGLSEDNILRTGFPRTDPLYDAEYGAKVAEKLKTENPALQNRKVILYAPTYRDGQLNQFDLQLDLDMLQRELGEEYVLLVRLHPAIRRQGNLEEMYKGFVFDYSNYPDGNDLLYITDCLITDYSSIIYEYAVFDKPMVFFAYDLDDYARDRGLWGDYASTVPGPVVYTTEELVRTIKNQAFHPNAVREFAQVWNEYSVGRSCTNLVEYIQGENSWTTAGQPTADAASKPPVSM